VPQVVQVAKEIGAIFKEVSGKHFALQATSDVGLYQLCERVHYTKRGAFDYSATADELVLALTYLQSLSKEALFYLVEASTGAMAFDLKDVGVQAVDLGSNIENCCGTPKQACSPETPTECKKAEATSDLEGLEMRIAELELQLAVLKQERDCLVENQKSQPNQTCTLCASSVSAISERAFSHYEDLIRQRVAGIEDLLATKTRGLVGGTWKDEPSETLVPADNLASAVWQVASHHYLQLEKLIVEVECQCAVLLDGSNGTKSIDMLVDDSTVLKKSPGLFFRESACTYFLKHEQHLEKLKQDLSAVGPAYSFQGCQISRV